MDFTKEELNPPQFRKAINNMCKECIYDEVAGFGTWRQQTENCTSLGCSLYSVRPVAAPYQKERAEARREHAQKQEEAASAGLESIIIGSEGHDKGEEE